MFEFRKAQEAGIRQIKKRDLCDDYRLCSSGGAFAQHGHHWFDNAESYFLVGDALGEGMKKLLEK